MDNQTVDVIKAYQFINKIKKLSFVDRVLLFGSRARKTNQQRSDIDIAVICPRATRFDWLQVVELVDQADTLLQIDCIRFDQADSEFQARILKDGIEL